MRPSQRRVLLDAALDVVAAEEGADITLDAVARRAGLSKPGLMYHFPTREALLLALVEHAAERVEAALLEQLGRPFEQATAAERHRAHVRVTAGEQVSRAEYAVYAEASYRPALTAPPIERMARWFDLPPGTPPATRARLTAARLAADGLWAADATGVLLVDPGDRAAVLAALDALTRDVADHSGRTAPWGDGSSWPAPSWPRPAPPSPCAPQPTRPPGTPSSSPATPRPSPSWPACCAPAWSSASPTGSGLPSASRPPHCSPPSRPTSR